MSNGNGQQLKSRFQGILDEINLSRNHWQQAKQLMYSLIADMDKADEFIGRFHESITRAINDNGGEADQTAPVEIEMQELVKKSLRGRHARQDQEGQEQPKYQIPVQSSRD